MFPNYLFPVVVLQRPMTPWSMCCVRLVVFGGKKIRVTTLSPWIFGCAGQLSMMRATLRR